MHWGPSSHHLGMCAYFKKGLAEVTGEAEESRVTESL